MHEHILIIENDDALARLMQLQLSRAGYDVTIRSNGAAGQEAAQELTPDLILIDVLLPAVDGWIACDALDETSAVPMVLVAALGSDAAVRRMLEMGADDYIIKPFTKTELVTRVKAALSRARRANRRRSTYYHPPLAVDLEAETVEIDGRPVYLTPLEYKLLAVLVQSAGRVVAHRTLLRRVWGREHEDRRQYLKLYIWYLRQKLEPDPSEPHLILTERGIGYLLVAPTRL